MIGSRSCRISGARRPERVPDNAGGAMARQEVAARHGREKGTAGDGLGVLLEATPTGSDEAMKEALQTVWSEGWREKDTARR